MERRFTVDTNLFRELGELLVGRDSTALLELVKNAYDADATKVTIEAMGTSVARKGVIRIVDDGCGITRHAFENGFLRIASRLKTETDRRSPKFRRRYTGAKGIGRLAAHKLAELIEIASVSDSGGVRERISARIDWRAIESVALLDEVPSDAIAIDVSRPPRGTPTGTTITLKRLRKDWTDTDRATFLAEADSFQPPSVLTEPLTEEKHRIAPARLLFDRPALTGVDAHDDGFRTEFAGDFDVGMTYWQDLGELAHWILEIDAQRSRVRYAVSASQRWFSDNGPFEQYRAVRANLAPEAFAFQARILAREGSARGPQDVRSFIARTHGIRCYMEGFRVQPYGDPGNDWLGIDRDVNRRKRGEVDGSLGMFSSDQLLTGRSTGLNLLPNRQYFGAVFLTSDGAPGLRMLVNREGFLPDTHFDYLTTTLRAGILLSARVRANAKPAKATRTRQTTGDLGSDLKSAAHQIRRTIAAIERGRNEAASEAASEAGTMIDAAWSRLPELRDEMAMIRVLASLGTQQAAFIHEIRAALGAARSIEAGLTLLQGAVEPSSDRSLRLRLARIGRAAGDLRRTLERHASYLTDVVTPDARRRRSKQLVHERFEAACDALRDSISVHETVIRNAIPVHIETPPMFRAEIHAVFLNLLTNAIKASRVGGRIRAEASQKAEGIVAFRLDNSGAAVDPTSAEKWFQPFTSTTATVDEELGQGMGLGLPITRRILADYAATIGFVTPRQRYDSAVQILFPPR